MANLSIHLTAMLSVVFRKKFLSRYLTFYFCLYVRASSIFLHELRVKTGLLPFTYCSVEFTSKVGEKISIIGVKQSLIGVNYRPVIVKAFR